MKLKYLLATALGVFLAIANLNAQDEGSTLDQQAQAQAQWDAFINSLGWKTDGSGQHHDLATLDIPTGYRFLNGEDAAKLMEAYGNLPSTYDGMIATDSLDWLVLFEFEKSGYVKDDEKDELNAKKLLSTMQEQQELGNEYRQERGLEPMFLDGWAVEPKYNETTNNLEWGLLLRSGSSGQFVNYNTKLLGREGIMNVTLICDLDKLPTVLPTYQDLLLGHKYNSGKSYADYRQGDKLAEYGLTALIAGGTLYGAAKLGFLSTIMVFFKKFFKLVIIAIVGIGVAIKKFFAKMAGREVREDSPTP